MSRWSKTLASAIGTLLAVGAANAGPAAAGSTVSRTTAVTAAPSTYVVDLVATAADGIDMNDAGDVVGTSRLDTGCGSTCLPPLDTVAWKNGVRIVLPTVPFSSYIFPVDINNQGWVVGSAGYPYTTTHAVVWKPVGDTYQAIDIGNLPGKTISTAVGIDDLGRVVGWSTTSQFPPSGAPFMWTEAGGMVDLTTLGFPLEQPLGISPGGTVATYGFWYRLDDPSSEQGLTTPPRGLAVENSAVAINDAGDQARFLVSVNGENLVYPFRYNHEGTWQQISSVPTGHLTSYGIGSINDARDITATVAGTGMVAYGPDGLAQDIAPLVSAAYGGSVLTSAGSMNANGEILASMIIGQSGQRLVRLTPAEPCTTNCIRVISIPMRGTGPAYCDQGAAKAMARLTVTNEAGAKLSGVTVTARFFDDYWLDESVVGTTNSRGQVTFKHVGPPCVGAIAILVTDATSVPARTLDATTGVLTNYVIPLP
jgi:probable HAF family extracellular repeat protein